MSQERYVTIMRHGEAVPFASKDFERSLTESGKVFVQNQALKLKQTCATPPDRIIASSAVRTTQTANLLAKGLAFDPTEVEFKEDLYDANSEIVKSTLDQNENFRHVVIVAHNPGVSNLVSTQGHCEAYMPPGTYYTFAITDKTWKLL